MKPELRYLSTRDIETIHESSLKILHEIGMKFPAREALDVFSKAGAKIIGDDTVLISESLINDALTKTLKRKDLSLFARDHKKDVTFKEDQSKIKTKNAPQNMSIIRNFIINIFRKHGYTNMAQAIRFVANDIIKMWGMILE